MLVAGENPRPPAVNDKPEVSNTAKLNLAFSVAVFTYNLRQNLLRHTTKIFFLQFPDKYAY